MALARRRVSALGRMSYQRTQSDDSVPTGVLEDEMVALVLHPHV